MTQELHYNQIPIDFGFFTVKTFDNFIIGDNKKLYSSLQNIINTDQLVLIYGNKSSGKTHICEALCNTYLDSVTLIDNKSKYTKAIQKVESMVKYFKNNHTQLYSNLDSIVYSQSQFLNFFISGCEIQLLKVHQDFFSDIKLKEFERKIKNLDLFINNENKDIKNIKQIDLRWDNIGEREGMIVWKNN